MNLNVNDRAARYGVKAEREPNRRRRGDYQAVALVFADLVKGASPWREALEDWDVEESPIVQEWTAQALERGLQRGLQQGLEHGREKLRGATLRVWRSRFTDPVPPDVVSAVQAQADLEALSQWFDAALDAATEAEARRVILG